MQQGDLFGGPPPADDHGRAEVSHAPAAERAPRAAPPPLETLYRLGGYSVIIADPPWRYTDSVRHALEEDYDGTMSTDEIAAMPVATHLAPPVGNLFLWTTSSFIEDAYRVARAWSYRPVQLQPWIKRRVTDVELGDILRLLPRAIRAAIRAALPEKIRTLLEERWQLRGPLQIGAGHYGRLAAEFVLICERGGATIEAEDRWTGVIEAPAKGKDLRHSQKPRALHEIAERISHGPYLELFGREKREGWTVWGNQVKEAA